MSENRKHYSKMKNIPTSVPAYDGLFKKVQPYFRASFVLDLNLTKPEDRLPSRALIGFVQKNHSNNGISGNYSFFRFIVSGFGKS